MADLDPNSIATHGGTAGVGMAIAMLWQKVFGGGGGKGAAPGAAALRELAERMEKLGDRADALAERVTRLEGRADALTERANKGLESHQKDLDDLKHRVTVLETRREP